MRARAPCTRSKCKTWRTNCDGTWATSTTGNSTGTSTPAARHPAKGPLSLTPMSSSGTARGCSSWRGSTPPPRSPRALAQVGRSARGHSGCGGTRGSWSPRRGVIGGPGTVRFLVDGTYPSETPTARLTLAAEDTLGLAAEPLLVAEVASPGPHGHRAVHH